MNLIPSLPFDGEYRASPSKRYREVIIFVHHFGGHKRSTKRHQEMVLNAGYDCVTFNLYYNSQEGKITTHQRLKNLISHFASGKRNFIDQWIAQLSVILDQIPGEKIVYSLSSPSTSVVGCVGHKERKDIKAWVCDCGPFLDVWNCFWNYNRYESRLSNWPSIALFNVLGFTMFGGIGYRARMQKWILRFPKDFPILSLRAGRDKLVPPQAIEKFFNLSSGLDLQTHLFSQADHLGAIKTDAGSYKSVVLTFLQKNSSLLETSKE